MSQNESQPAGSKSLSSAVGGMPRWKKVLLTTAIFLVAAGLGLKAFALAGGGRGRAAPSSSAPAADTGTSGISRSLAPEGAESSFFPGGEAIRIPRSGPGEAEPIAGRPAARSTFEDWSPVLVRGGLSFLVGFCVGYAVRTFLRLSAVFAGLIFLSMFGLSYAGVLEIHWDVLQAWFDRSVASLKDMTSNFQAFMSGSLPVAGAATAGLFTGIKKS